MAAVKNCIELVKTLESRGCDVLQKTPAGDTCVTLAAKHDSSAVLEYLVDKMDDSKEELQSVLRVSAEKGDAGVMSRLLERGVSVNGEDCDGNTALMVACKNRQTEWVRSLLTHKTCRVSVNEKNKEGKTSLHLACEQPLESHGGHSGEAADTCDSVNLLVDKTKVDYETGRIDREANMTDFESHDVVKIVRLLLQHGANPQLTDSRGFNCLHAAVNADSFDVTHLLLTHCHSLCPIIHCKTNHGDTCLSLALKNANREITNLLRKHGAQLDLQTLPTAQVINKLLSKGNTETVKWLLGEGIDVNVSGLIDRHLIFDILDYGAAEMLTLFIDKGADIECEDSAGYTPFLRSLLVGREDLAKIFLDRGCRVDVRTKRGWDCVAVAVTQKRLHTVKWLFTHLTDKINKDNLDEDKMTALHLAALKGHPGIFRFLCSQGYSMTEKCKKGWTPVDYAIANGHLAVVKTGMQSHRDVVMECLMRMDGESSLVEAARHGCQNILEFWYSLGVNIEEAHQPFLSACLNGQQHVVEWFISMGLDVTECRDAASGATPLLYAIESGNLHLVKFLVEDKKCDILLTNNNGRGATHSAVVANQKRMLDYVISKGAPVDAADAQGDTPLLEAALRGHIDMMEILLSHNCDIMKLNERGQNAVHMAVIEQDNAEMLQFLSDKQVPINSRDNGGNTPLMIACYQGHLSAVEFFLNADASWANEKNQDDSTPALLAAMKGRHEVVRMLGERGCSMDEADKDGNTALMLAIESASVETVRILLELNKSDLSAVNGEGCGVVTLAEESEDRDMQELLVRHGLTAGVRQRDRGR
ncbi:MAG: ankyrin repeat domain-containing protein [Kangiellaceae bacterium]|nr:ankyrin repeat domain-containing protein [Kangiellaceae bacterium]